MSEVVGEILLCLLVAAALGAAIGWLARGLRLRVAAADEAERRRSVDELQARLEAVESSRGELVQELGERRTLTEAARREADVLRRELRDADQARDATQKEAATTRERLLELSAQLSDMEAAGAAAKTEAAHARREAERLRGEVASRSATSEPTMQQVKTLRATLSAAESGWDSARAQAEAALQQLAIAGRRITESDAARTALAGRLAEAEGRLGECRNEVAELLATLAELRAPPPPPPPLEPVPVPVPHPPPAAHFTDAKDDLQRIRGIGPVLERLLHRAGVYRYAQIASWTREDIQAISDRLPGFHSRIRRDGWMASARRLHLRKYGRPPDPS
jgi:hypothetical protein